MSAFAKLYLWKDQKPVSNEDVKNLSIKVVDSATGEFVVEGADVGVFYQHMFILQNNETKESTDD